jgi:hypothetical protein
VRRRALPAGGRRQQLLEVVGVDAHAVDDDDEGFHPPWLWRICDGTFRPAGV